MPDIEPRQPGPGSLRMPAGTAGLPVPACRAQQRGRRDPRVHGGGRAHRGGNRGVHLYWHAYAVVRQYGESGVTALLEPGTIDGLVYASSMVILYAARHRLPVPRLARWMLAFGIAAWLAVNVAQGWSHGMAGAAAAAWPAVALAGSYELLARMIRTTAGGGPDHAPPPDHGVPQADHPAARRFPDARAVPAAASGDGASPEPGSTHDRFPVACAVARVCGPGPGGSGCMGRADRGNQAGGPVRESTGPRGPGGPAAPGPVIATAPAGDIDVRCRLPRQPPGRQAVVRAQAGSGIRQDLTAVGA